MAAIAYPVPARRPRLRVVPDIPEIPGRCLPEPRATSAVYWRRRSVALAALAVAVLLAVRVATALLAGIEAGGPGTPAPAVSVRPAAASAPVHLVQPGETLWTIARALQPRGDVRPLVDRLAKARGGAALQVGDRIPLP